ncbi:hypothetical protein JB92DRAFT_2833868 [Gautieria morchelliformis]|nr:hypothetical protein JB92DRAFT_2833868 [Gautieria morchelliformis]
MNQIPDRKNLQSLSRMQIQTLCKDNNIKANMKTDDMINALCDLVNGKDVPRPLRAASERVASQPPPKGRVASVPVLARARGARNVSKAITRSTGRRTRASATLQEEHITEETDEAAEHANTDKGTIDRIYPTTMESDIATRLSSAHRIAPINGVARGSRDEPRLQVHTPTGSHPSYATPSAQLAAIQSRITQLEDEAKVQKSQADVSHAELQARVARLEIQAKEMAVENGNLKHSISELETMLLNREEARDPSMAIEISHPPEDNDTSDHGKDGETDANPQVVAASGVAVPAKVIDACELPNPSPSRPTLGKRTRPLVDTPDVSVMEDGEQLHEGGDLAAADRATRPLRKRRRLDINPEEDAGPSPLVRPGPDSQSSPCSELPPFPSEFDTSTWDDSQTNAIPGAAGGSGVAAPAKVIDPAELPDPSPSQPILGKRTRGLVDTPDVSATGDGAQEHEGGDLAAADRRRAYPLMRPGPDGPWSTSTPQHRSKSPAGFFTAGSQAPPPLARTGDADVYLRLEGDDLAMPRAGTSTPTNIAGPSNTRAMTPAEGAPCTPPPRRADAGPSSNTRNPRDSVGPTRYQWFFDALPPPAHYEQHSFLPIPLVPTTPSNGQDIPERSAQFGTPVVGSPWKLEAAGSPGTISQGVPLPRTPTHIRDRLPSFNAVPPESPGSTTSRAGGRRERNDTYDPFSTPQRGSGSRHRTAITPARGLSLSLQGSPRLPTVEEESTEPGRPEVDEDGIARSPPPLRTLYGTELAGHTRFGDYGRDVGRHDWGKAIPR